jgi:hypothetical protein
MTNPTWTDHIDRGSSSGSSQPIGSATDRAVGSAVSSDRSAVAAWSDPSTLREEVANLKDILSRYILGRRKRHREK